MKTLGKQWLKEKKKKKEIKVVLENLFITPFISREDPNWGPPKLFLEKTMKVSYAKAVNKIEKFMKNSGIRAICSDLCIGMCCGSCYKSDFACHKNEGRRLACSFYMCRPLRQLLFTEYEAEIFNSVDQIIRSKIRDSMPGYTPGYSSIYFDINGKSMRDRFSINIAVLNRLNKIDTSKISGKVDAFRELYQKFSNRQKEINKQ